MLSLSLARQLKEAGLAWQPAVHDFFAVPDRGLDERVFVISSMAVLVELLQGQPAVTFHGTAEWALDYVMLAELVWLPSEAQLRQALEATLPAEPEPLLRLTRITGGYRCEIRAGGRPLVFEAAAASEAYAAALLHVLRSR